MAASYRGVPWGNLWRWIVSTFLFMLLIGLPPAYLTAIDTEYHSVFLGVVILVSAIIGAVVVWSERIPWPGD